MRSVIGVCFVLSVGCGEVVGLDDYEVSEPEAVPYLDGAECRACLASRCADQVNTCEADDLCRTTLSCRRGCEAPDCHVDCSHPQSDDWRWNQSDLTLAQPFPADRPVSQCAQTECVAECSIGRSWACVGTYDWMTPPPGMLRIRHRTFSVGWQTSIVGAKVRACDSVDVGCGTALADGWTDTQGRVELTIEHATRFELYLAIDAEPDAKGNAFPPYVHFGKQKPRYDGEYNNGTNLWTIATLNTNLAAGDQTYDPTRSYFFPQFFDCAGFWADDLVVDLEVWEGGVLRPCADCVRVYTRSLYPDPAATHTRPDGAMVMFLAAEPKPVVITARDRSTETLVARVNVVLQPGRVHYMGVQPLTTSLASEN